MKQAVESEARRFVEQWVACFNERDLDGLDRLSHESRPETSRAASRKYLGGLVDGARYEVVRWTLAPWKQPTWSIFNTNRFEPPPTHMANVFLENPDGITNEIFVAFAQQQGVSRSCYYVSIPKRVKVRKLDLPAHEGQVKRFIKAAIKKLAKLKLPDPVTQLLLSFSVEQGQLTISFDTRPDYEPGDCEKMSHYDFHRLLLPKWARFTEDGHTIVGEGGRVFTLHDPAKDAGSPVPLAEIVGQWLVALVVEMVDAGQSSALGSSEASGYGVEEVEGKFGWPAYEER